MASISRERVLLLLYLISYGNTMENKCKSTVDDNLIPVVSFCIEHHVINSSITLDAYLPLFGASSFFCMCEVKILSTQKFGSLLISQESTIIPPANCGLQLKIANATGVIRTVHCSYVGKAEYILIQGSSIVISLANISKTWSEGYCFHFSLRFENSPISVQCFNPGVTILPSQPYNMDTPTTSTTVSAITNTFSFPSTTNTDSSTLTYVTSNEKSGMVTTTTSTESQDSTRAEFSKTSPTTSKHSTTTMVTTTMDFTEIWTPRETSTAAMPSIQVPSTYIPMITRTAQSQSPTLTSSSWKYTIPAIGGLIILTVSIVMAVCYNYRKSRKNMINNTKSSNVNLPYSQDFTYEN